jgi:endonuclease/exonuclease/phosphatase family metal-dependent hydrolase
MRFRVVTLNLEQNHKRWERRRHLIDEEICRLKPDIVALNEVSIPLQSARDLQKTASNLLGVQHNLVQQTRVNGLSKMEGEAMLTRFAVIETGNLDYQTADICASCGHSAVLERCCRSALAAGVGAPTPSSVSAYVNAGQKMHQRAGLKMHHG